MYRVTYDDKQRFLDQQIEMRKRQIKNRTDTALFRELEALRQIQEDLSRLQDLES